MSLDPRLQQEARQLDETDALAGYRELFHIPRMPDGKEYLYFAGNSLGLQPKSAQAYVMQELEDWAKLGVEGHQHAKHAWLPYHEFLTPMTARLVGAKDIEVITMNSLTVNVHLLMASFYRPTSARHKILIEGGAFPSDQYAVKSQIRFHGRDPAQSLIELFPREGEETLRPEDILREIEMAGPALALALIGNVNYRTGQCFDIRSITAACHKVGAFAGFDLAHGAGNLHLQLHDDGPDFAAWCSYKYLNAGPGAIAGAFIHERHARNSKLSRFEGWWGHNKQTRFAMGPDFDGLPGAEGWQLSNPPILQLAALRASMEIFDRAGMQALRAKSDRLTRFLEGTLSSHPKFSKVKIITPSNLEDRGTQLSLRFPGQGRDFVTRLHQHGAICDFREPDIVRVAPVPLYTRFADLVNFMETLERCL